MIFPACPGFACLKSTINEEEENAKIIALPFADHIQEEGDDEKADAIRKGNYQVVLEDFHALSKIYNALLLVSVAEELRPHLPEKYWHTAHVHCLADFELLKKKTIYFQHSWIKDGACFVSGWL
jgi:hypothetical protein